MVDGDRRGAGTLSSVGDAVYRQGTKGPLSSRLSAISVWLLVDANRWLIVALISLGVYVTVVGAGLLGPWTQQQYLIEETAISDAYIELQPGIINVIVVTLGINQLVLAPEIGPVSQSKRRLEDTISEKKAGEDVSGADSISAEPAEFLGTIVAATGERASKLGTAANDLEDRATRNRIQRTAADIARDADRVADALGTHRFGGIEMLGVAMHFDTGTNLNRLRALENEVSESLSTGQMKALADVIDAMEQVSVAREYFRTLYVRSEFIRFSRAILFTGVPALVVAHLGVGIIGSGVLPGSTFGVRNLLWFEAGTFTVAVVPVAVVVSYIARLTTIAETSLFLGPFLPRTRTDSRFPEE